MIEKILEENKRRLARIHRRFDPLSGEGSTGERFETLMPGAEDKSPIWLPVSMKGIRLTPGNYEHMRSLHDFPYWAAKYVYITGVS